MSERDESGRFVKATDEAAAEPVVVDEPTTEPADEPTTEPADEPVVGAGPVVGQAIDFEAVDPILGTRYAGRGVVVEVHDEHLVVAPVAAYTVQVSREG